MRTTLLLAGMVLGLPPAGVYAQDAERDPVTSRSPFHRARSVDRDRSWPAPRAGGLAMFPLEFRSIDGTGNNLMHPEWGAAGVEFIRVVPTDYADGVGTPSGADRPSARLISNLVVAQDDVSIPNTRGYSDFIWQWGQFLDHDIDETPITDPGEAFDIPVPTGDMWFDPFVTGTATIPLDRSAWTLDQGVREQFNLLTAYIDASNVYGSEEERTHELRALDGTGKLKTSAGDLLPFNVNGFDNAPTSSDPSYFLAGDIRANEQVGLTAMHTLFMREHNRLAEQIAQANPDFSGDEIFERARAIVGAEMQAITYNEFLPKLLGRNAIPPYRGYRPEVNASIANVFATAAYRVGHTMLSTQILRLDANGDEIAAGHLDLASAFFAPSEVTSNGIDSLLRGLASQHAQNIDAYVVDDIRNFLFGPPGAGGFDLASLNIQRGRDHGLPSYNAVRVAFGRPPATSFEQVNPDPVVAGRLASAYDSVDQIDPWVGLLAERHRPGAFVGETLYRVLRDQFILLRDGDRFWYESYLPAPLVNQVESLNLAEIIRLNTSIGDELQDDVFSIESPCIADLAPPFGVLNFADISAFLQRFGGGDLEADMDGDGVLSFTDVSLFLVAFDAGCAN
ncbi:MAG: peroxidase family protein [Phycisphaerales bacterium JB059]